METIHEISKSISKYIQVRWKDEEEKFYHFLNHSCSFIITLIFNKILKNIENMEMSILYAFRRDNLV